MGDRVMNTVKRVDLGSFLFFTFFFQQIIPQYMSDFFAVQTEPTCSLALGSSMRPDPRILTGQNQGTSLFLKSDPAQQRQFVRQSRGLCQDLDIKLRT